MIPSQETRYFLLVSASWLVFTLLNLARMTLFSKKPSKLESWRWRRFPQSCKMTWTSFVAQEWRRSCRSGRVSPNSTSSQACFSLVVLLSLKARPDVHYLPNDICWSTRWVMWRMLKRFLMKLFLAWSFFHSASTNSEEVFCLFGLNRFGL